jgi:hypothetical protein
MSHKSKPHVGVGEYIAVHLLLVLSVLALTWGPLVYLARTVALHSVGGGF